MLQSDQVNFQSVYDNKKTTVWIKSKTLDLIPNAISLQHSTYQAAGFAMGPLDSLKAFDVTKNPSYDFSYCYYSLSGGPTNGESRNDYALSLSNFDPNLGRHFDFISKWTTETNLRRSTNYAIENKRGGIYDTNSQTWQNINYDRSLTKINQYQLGAGIGPELGVVGALGYLYVNLLFGVEYQYIDFQDQGSSFSTVYSPISSSVGYRLAFLENWQLGMSTTYRALPEWLSNKIISEASGQKIEGAVNSELKFTFSLSYQFPEMKQLGRKKAREWVGSL